MQGVVEDIVRRAEQKPQDGDYEQDGLLYCGKCHTRRQTVVELLGRKRIVGVMCACRTAAYEQEERRWKREQRFHKVIARMEPFAIKLRGDPSHVHPRVMQYLRNWDRMFETGTGLLLWGGVGTGKSTSAAYMVGWARQRYITAVMTNLAQFGDVKTDVPDFSAVDLLVIDDLGAERDSDFMLERIFEILDGRARCGKPTVYTTNLTVQQMDNPPNVQRQRIYSRVREKTIPIFFDGIDHRTEHAKATEKLAMEVFGGVKRR